MLKYLRRERAPGSYEKYQLNMERPYIYERHFNIPLRFASSNIRFTGCSASDQGQDKEVVS